MSEAIKPTQGEWAFRDDDGWRLYIDGISVMGDAQYYPWVPDNKADWILFADAGNTYNTTGLTPRQLVERVKELEEALGKLAKSYERVMQMGAPPPDSLKAARAALSKALPNTVAEVK